jgi:hypothetical protein
MNECIACGASGHTYFDLCRDCADVSRQDVEGASWVSGMIAARNRPVDMSDPWDRV